MKLFIESLTQTHTDTHTPKKGLKHVEKPKALLVIYSFNNHNHFSPFGCISPKRKIVTNASKQEMVNRG